MSVSVQQADFDAGAEIAALSAGREDVGAVASFVGLVRADKQGGIPCGRRRLRRPCRP
jgi:molybdopterin synthase catalytic subunit